MTTSSTEQPIQAPDMIGGPPRGARARPRPLTVLVVSGIGLAALLWAFRTWRYGQSHETTENAQIDGHIVPVLAKVGGYVRGVSVAENDSVRAGQLLVQIDDTELRQRVAQSVSELAAAQATAGTGRSTGVAQAQVTTSVSQRASLDAQGVAARAQARRAEADLLRGNELLAKEIISRQQFDALRAAAEAAQANVLSIERQAAAAGSSVTSAEAGVRLAEARLGAAKAVRDNADLQLQYTRVTAPESGTIARRVVEVGQLVQAGQPLMAIVSDSGVWVSANFKETQLSAMRVGQEVEIAVDAYDKCHATGRIASISSTTGAKFALLPPDNATGNFTKVVQRIPVRIQVMEACGPGMPLRPGMSSTVVVRTR